MAATKVLRLMVTTTSGRIRRLARAPSMSFLSPWAMRTTRTAASRKTARLKK